MDPARRLLSGIFLALLFGLFGLFLVVMGGIEVYRAGRLSEHSATIEARAFDWSTVSENAGTSYELHYEFQIGGTTYSAGDATGRSGLWQEVPYDTWVASQGSGTLTVRYVPEEPSINEPAVYPPGDAGDHVVEVILGAVCCLGGLVVPLLALVRPRR
ncbi:MAG: DUF3592 domain-containing protein [Sandaracinaceae bacterium]|nr:DUF3592 domain-containing protein [Sandaracinaceae bacterium]